MDNFQAYIMLFQDSFITSLMFVPRTAYVSDVMITIGDYNAYLIFIVSFIAGVIGLSVNWMFGRIVRKLERFEFFSDRIEALINMEEFFNKKGKWILLLAVIPLWGALLTTAAGVMRYRFSHFLILISFSKFIGLAIEIFFT